MEVLMVIILLITKSSFQKTNLNRKKMKQKIIIAIIYLSGCVCSYNYGKCMKLKIDTKWTKKDRSGLIICSSASWFTFTIIAITDFVSTFDDESTANW